MPSLRIILVEPREAGNVGAAARSMKNFGFSELVIVGDHPTLQPVAEWWASGAGDLVHAARIVPTLQTALAGSHLTIATTSSRGRNADPDLEPRALAALYAAMPEQQVVSLVFGREDRGLTRSELNLCSRTAVIPTSELLPTMNLAQSVSLFCYELSRVTAAAGPRSRDLAPSELIDRLHERGQSLLMEIGFLHENNPDRIYDDLRRILARAQPDSRETEILLGIMRQLEWAMRERAGR
ncbi:MAG TPA: RNA methyltransferase [Thermoanaerobaculia bacterium]|nr:RNA methyltransferase [Thermoanaerobaculia bacterium]